jgi:hypothetical protein
MKIQLVTPYRVILLQRYGVMVRSNVTSVYAPLECSLNQISRIKSQSFVPDGRYRITDLVIIWL